MIFDGETTESPGYIKIKGYMPKVNDRCVLMFKTQYLFGCSLNKEEY